MLRSRPTHAAKSHADTYVPYRTAPRRYHFAITPIVYRNVLCYCPLQWKVCNQEPRPGASPRCGRCETYYCLSLISKPRTFGLTYLLREGALHRANNVLALYEAQRYFFSLRDKEQLKNRMMRSLHEVMGFLRRNANTAALPAEHQARKSSLKR